ncbi:MAG: type II secretion system minor pseudopilin GspK [Gammaproteobacteria bacterium]|uniref:type II secretion system minor pseudopilin GspK n=1 Tax=Rhodoferax sp. TaxID=50421 RepID=UPI00181FEAF7|nr:type II secretion system minor pseudopilin GspK [Rhodoferax sp.]MBU3900474.1 type II secretion system minor pseudopilin GspK [Gammaproteobacteria bacterium]MBA3059941.1 general secretion pathway protein GspK [Rhodoferax sp.]MBU3997122.1 type II secretion system minor pseudopilin GspK [Gammaproteobacteria bacterium]MBU4079919.1 type II secretion system minor pseudopilin GspK [Gammaproteobacteria bacterium]MBU4112934.1 type II secretion system minor pseudopilin GspK [Gammaproteobacteria bacte
MKSQRGAAILTAMLTVVLVASLASATLWQQWRAVEVEAAERSRVQSAWILNGALDWARLILREDGRKGGADHLAEPWAVPLAPARLSSFLAADRSDAIEADAAQEAFLSGQITDLQSRLNVANLVQGGAIDAPSALAFSRLFELLDLPETELILLQDKLRLAQGAPTGADAAPVDAPDAANSALWPQTIDQLAWFGLSARSIAVLRPFITVLPVRTPVNLNTAPAEVIYACVDSFDLADADRLVRERNATHLAALSDAGKLSGRAEAQFDAARHSVSSRFFEVRGSLRIDQATVQEQSVVQRDGLDVKTLSRQRGVAGTTPTLQ